MATKPHVDSRITKYLVLAGLLGITAHTAAATWSMNNVVMSYRSIVGVPATERASFTINYTGGGSVVGGDFGIRIPAGFVVESVLPATGLANRTVVCTFNPVSNLLHVGVISNNGAVFPLSPTTVCQFTLRLDPAGNASSQFFSPQLVDCFNANGLSVPVCAPDPAHITILR